MKNTQFYLATVVQPQVNRSGIFTQKIKPFCQSVNPTWDHLGPARKAQIILESKRLGIIASFLKEEILFFSVKGPVADAFYDYLA